MYSKNRKNWVKNDIMVTSSHFIQMYHNICKKNGKDIKRILLVHMFSSVNPNYIVLCIPKIEKGQKMT